MIWTLFRKDWTLLWPLAVLVTLIQVAFEWAIHQYGFFGGSPLARELLRLLMPAWNIGILALAVAVVHEDTIPGVDQDWLIRPLVRTDLLLAKLLFVAITVCLPMLAVNLIDELALGFPVVPSLGDALYKEAYLFVCLMVPAIAVASATRNMIELVVLVAGLVVLYAVCLWFATTLFGVDRCPTCDTSLAWLQHLLQHFGVLVGSGVVLALQYYRRKTQVSRLLLAVGVVMLVVVQLPWDVAFAIQSRMGVPVGTQPAAITIAAEPAEVTIASDAAPGSTQDTARRATKALLQGDVDGAVQNLEGLRARADVPALLKIPLRISGIAGDDFLVVDRAEFALVDAHGTVLYRGAGVERTSVPLTADWAEPVKAAAGNGEPGKSDPRPRLAQQTFELPRELYTRVRSRAASLVIDYFLTVRTMVAEHRIRASGGEIRSPEVGICQSDADSSAAYIRCRQIGRSPNCFAATLYGPDGQHNPQVRRCGSDYRPFVPAPMTVISFAAMELPIRDAYGVAHYQVDGSDLPDSYILFKVYETGRHFRRTVVSQLQMPATD